LDYHQWKYYVDAPPCSRGGSLKRRFATRILPKKTHCVNNADKCSEMIFKI
jgi:hypothetical protein